ncbi:MAG: PD40 domain-containing protein [Anaerolineae bacterium]|nr:PD40 domain-containing protein [Anaerolineae bacterium]
MIAYRDFSIKIEPRRGDEYPVIILHSPAGEARSSFRLPFHVGDTTTILINVGSAISRGAGEALRQASPAATRSHPQQIGAQLFNSLFSGPVRDLYYRSLGMLHGQNEGLRLKLHIDPEDQSLALLASLPWELMYRKETREFLCLSSQTPLVRYLDIPVPYSPLVLEPPLRILVVISSPRDHPPLELTRERRQIEETWAGRQDVVVEYVERATLEVLQDRLAAHAPHVLHYMGHGSFDRQSGCGVLLLEDEAEKGLPVDGTTLGVLLRNVPTLRLVFLNACETARVARRDELDPFAGVAAAMVMAGIPAVVAMQFPISDSAAVRFASRFYPLLARGEPVDHAVAQGRLAIRVTEGDTMEWATPVLFMRAPTGVIFEVKKSALPMKRVHAPARHYADGQREELEQLYIDGLAAYHTAQWQEASNKLQAVVDIDPDYEAGNAHAKLQDVLRQQQLHDLYDCAQAAREEQDWGGAITVLEELTREEAHFLDAATLLESVRRQKQLEDYYTEAQQLAKAEQWRAVANIFAKITALDPEFTDAEGLLATAERHLETEERQARLGALYREAVRRIEEGNWAEAKKLLVEVEKAEPGFRNAARLLARSEAEIARQGSKPAREEPGLSWRGAASRRYRLPLMAAGAAAVALILLGILYLPWGGISQATPTSPVADMPAGPTHTATPAITSEPTRTPEPTVSPGSADPTSTRTSTPVPEATAIVTVTAAGTSIDTPVATSPPARTPTTPATATPIPGIIFSVFPSGVEHSGDDFDIWVMDTDGSSRHKLQNNEKGGVYEMRPLWLAGKKGIVYERKLANNVKIWQMAPDGSDRRVLLGDIIAEMPALSPDGKMIAFVKWDGNKDIYVSNLSGSNLRQITTHPADDEHPHWAPDGSQIAFSTLRATISEIYVMDSDGSNQHNLTERTNDYDPTWSPDGKQIAFVSFRDGDAEVYVMNANGSRQRNVSNNHSANDVDAAWTPDGRILFASNRNGDYEIYVVKVDGSGLTQLTNNDLDDRWPDWK